MANSKYEYVKSFESEDEVMYPNLIVVRIDGRNFARHGTQAQEKNQMLSQLFGIDDNTLPVIFRNGSSVFWDKEMIVTDNGVVAKSHEKVFVEHPNIIEDDFWVAHPLILETTSPTVADLAR
ncbi:putative tRNA(His) guanylyltransferase [Helianthus annuus]|nr:putative tRNA(His) guanylyltransferase [Helianthus annuus]